MTTLTTGSPSTTTSTSGIQSYAIPYAQQNLANAWALSQQPYQPYQGQQNAAMTGLQNQAFTSAGNMGVNQNSIQAGNTAGQAANNLLNTNYSNPYTAQIQGWNNQAASDFMNPYVSQSLAPQLQLLQQQQGMQANQNASQATQAGAFGGSRFGIQQGLQNQSNQLAQNSLVGNAYNTAYNNAQQQFNTQNALGLQAQQANIAQQQFGANLGLQANSAAANAASAQSNIGNTQNAQNQNATVLQNQLGTEQQQYQQGLLNTQYQNYVNQLNYPYQQAAFAQNMINGYPVSSTTSTTQPSSPSYLQDLASLGIGAYGLSQLAKGGQAKSKAYKDGGEVKRYADGGSSLTSVLERGIADAQSIGDYPTVQALTNELNNMGGTTAPQAAQTMPSSGAAAAGSYGANPNIGASGLTGGVGQMGISGASGQRSAATPGSTASGSNSLIPQDLQTILQMKKDANKLTSSQQDKLMQQLDESGGLSSYFGVDPSTAETDAELAEVSPSAKGGLQSIPLSDSVLPTVSKKRGGITDVARYADNGVTTSDDRLPIDVFSNMDDNSLDLGAPSTLNTIREARGLPAVPVEQVAQAPQQAGIANPTPSGSIQAGLQAGAQAGTPRQMANNMMSNFVQHTPLTAEERISAVGPAPTFDYQSLRDELAKQKVASSDSLRQGRVLAASAAAGAMLEGNQFGRGVGQAATAFGSSYGNALSANQKAQENLVAMNMKLSQAEHADKLGLYKTKVEAFNAAQKDAQKFDENSATLFKAINAATKENQPKAPEQALAAINEYNANPTPYNKKMYDAAVEYLNLSHPAVLAANVNQGGENVRNAATNLTGITKEQEAIKAKNKTDAKKVFNSPMFSRSKDTKPTFEKYMRENGNDLVKAQAAYARDVANEEVSSAAPAPRAGTPREVPSSDILPYDVSSKQNPTEAQHAKLKPGEKFYWNGQLLSKGQ
jgi:hypothetical protein